MPPAAPLPTQAALLHLSGRLAGIWTLLSRGIGVWGGREKTTPLPVLAQTRASRLVARLQALLALLAAGGRPAVHPPRLRPTLATVPEQEAAPEPAPAPAPEAGSPRPPAPRRPRLPRRLGWLMPQAIEIRWAAGQLRHWLADPATRAVLAEVPQARRPLAALCRMLAIPPWPLDPDGPPPPAPRAPRVRKPRAPRPVAAAERAAERAALWQHRSLETAGRPPRRPWWLPPKRG